MAACQISVRVFPEPAWTSKIDWKRLPKFMTSLGELSDQVTTPTAMMPTSATAAQSTAFQAGLSRKRPIAITTSATPPPIHAPRVNATIQHHAIRKKPTQ